MSRGYVEVDEDEEMMVGRKEEEDGERIERPMCVNSAHRYGQRRATDGTVRHCL